MPDTVSNLIVLSPSQHATLRAELIERTARRLLRHVQDGSSREDRVDARNTARIEAGRIVDDLLGLVMQTERLVARPTLRELLVKASA